ncbi:MAG TPA: CheR family methyltransferase [Streptosporangiaceae bacterium]
MTRDLTDVAELVRRETGIAFPPDKAVSLRAAMDRAAPGLDPESFLRAIGDPLTGNDLRDRFIDEVTIQETTFVRDRSQLDAIAWNDLYQGTRAAGSSTIRVWSAGCATGEEVYTLALLAAEAFAPERPPVDVLGTDISEAALTAARVASYGERAVRALDHRLLERYFHHQDGSYHVTDDVRSLVRFRRHNLAVDAMPPLAETGFDLVICRNVLIYFETPLAIKVIEGLTCSLRPGGTLLLGAADGLQRTLADYQSRDRPAGGARRASRSRPRTPPAAARPPPHGLSAPAHRPAPPSPPTAGCPPTAHDQRLAAALAAADKGDREGARALVAKLLADDPLDADAHYLKGLVDLADGDPQRAVRSLRASLYNDPGFGLAAFALGRAYDALAEPNAARRAYELALRTLDPSDRRHEVLLQQVDIADIAAACRLRLAG